MKYRLKVISAALLTALAVTACGSDDDGGLTIVDSEMNATDTPDATDPETTDSETDETDSELAAYIGSWATGCVPSQFPAASVATYFTHDVQFDATTWQFTMSGYLDESCTVQSQEIDGGTTMRGTTTMTGNYVDGGELVTTADGIPANNLSLTIDTFTNTLDETDETANEAIGTTSDVLVHVNDADVLYLDDALFGINEAPGTLVLTLPFYPAR